MKRILTILLLLTSFAATSQIYQKIPGYGFRWDRVMPDSVLHVPKSTDTAFRTNSRLPQIRIVGDSLWLYDGAKWKRAGASGGSTVTTLPWDSITGKPANFSTTYALSNDIADSIQARVIVKDNADYRIVTGTANVKELKAQSRLNFYPDSGIMVVSAAPGSGYGAEIDFDNIATNGTQWGLYGGSTSVPGMIMYRYAPTQIELAYWDADRYALRSDVKMAWSSTLMSFGTPDVAISREGASLLQINNGTTNSYADLKLRTLTSTDLAGTGTRMVVANASGALSTQAIPTSSVVSVFGRSGTVTAQSGDYTTAQVTESGNLYFTNGRAISALTGQNVSIFVNDAGYITSASLSGYVPTARTLTINGTTLDLSANRSFTVGDVVTSGSYANPAWITSLAWGKITGAPAFITGITGSDVTTALGYTPYNSSNPAGYITSSALSGYAPINSPAFTGTVQAPTLFVNRSSGFQGALQVTSSGGGILIDADNSNFGLTIRNSSSSLKAWDISPFNNDLAINESGVNTRIFLKAGGNNGVNTNTPTEAWDVNGNVKANSFIKVGGTSSQYLMADGSVSTGGGSSSLTVDSTTIVNTNYTLVLSDSNKFFRVKNGSTALTITIPANSTVAFPVGTIIYIQQQGTAQITVSGASGVVIESADGLTKTSTTFGGAVLVKTSNDVWGYFGSRG
jgi:hypothetical protein